MPLFNKSYIRRRVAEHRPKASNPQNPPTNQDNRNHQHTGHPTTAPLPWGEGSGRPAGQEGQLSCRRKVQKNELGAGHRGGRGRGPNQTNPKPQQNTTHNTQPQPPTEGRMACTVIATRSITKERSILVSQSLPVKTCSNSRQNPRPCASSAEARKKSREGHRGVKPLQEKRGPNCRRVARQEPKTNTQRPPPTPNHNPSNTKNRNRKNTHTPATLQLHPSSYGRGAGNQLIRRTTHVVPKGVQS